MGFWSNIGNFIKENVGKIAGVTAGIILAPATGGASLALGCAAAGFVAGSIVDDDMHKREQENKKLVLAGKAGEVITNQVNGLQDDRSKKVAQLNNLEQLIQQKKNKLNDPNVSESEKIQIRSELASFVAQADKLKEEILGYDKKIEELLKNIPDGSEKKKGGLINLESMDPQTKMIMGAIIFLIIYFAFIKDKERD